ncbi:MAG: hypothetical protein ACRC9Y_16200 [Aeromonas veronii]
MAKTPTLITSGNILFNPSPDGLGPALPPAQQKFLNQKILEIDKAISDLESSGVKPGKDGHDVEISAGFFPATDPNKQPALLWRLRAKAGETPMDWNLLIYKKEIEGPVGKDGPEGPQGPTGPEGPEGTGIKFHASVKYEADLIKTPSVVGDGVLVTGNGNLWVLTELPYTTKANWKNLGHIQGPKGPTGARGPRGPTGPEGPSGSGGIGMFLLQWIVDSATAGAISAVTSIASSEIASAMDTLFNQMASVAETTAENVVQEALDKAWDELKGDKGEKGDKGDKGDDGKSVQLVGKFKTVAAFQAKYPLFEANVGKAGLCGDDPTKPKELWAILQDSSGTFPYPPTYVNLGDIRGPQGEAARWEVSLRDTGFVEKTKIVVDSDVDPSVASMYIRDTDSIVVEGLNGSEVAANQVGFKIHMRYPISRPAKKDDPSGKPSTVGKVLSNDGEKLIWIDPPAGGKPSKDKILIKAPDGTVWAITVDNNGRLFQSLSIDPSEDVGVDIAAPNGSVYTVHVDNTGQLQVTNKNGIRVTGTP